MKVLVACEESQVVTSAFRRRGVDAFSCDIQDCSGGHPEWHYKADALSVLSSISWDIVIAHPPCTYLTKAGANLMFPGGVLDKQRYSFGLAACEFFMSFYRYDGRICIENPIPMHIFDLPQCTQIVQPWYFGDPYTKATCLWLKGLPALMATDLVVPVGSWTALHKSARVRSRTFPGLADAFASQFLY